jgi:hypothetical protein
VAVGCLIGSRSVSWQGMFFRDTVDEVLAETGKNQRRTRLLPAHVMVYFVIAMAVFHDGYEELIRKMVNGLQFLRGWSDSWSVPTTSAITQARDRLGEQPMKVRSERVAGPLATPGSPGRWRRSWRLMAIDAVQVDVPDSPANLAEFGKYEGGTRRPFPQIHAVGLGECGTHAVVASTLGTIYDGQRKLALALLGSVTPDMLIIADRGYYAFDLWQQFMVTGASLLWRVTAGIKLPIIDVLPDGSYLSEINNTKTRSGAYRIPRTAVEDPRDATHLPVRVIEYTVGEHENTESERFRLITTILDPQDAGALELAAAYQQRWEYDISLTDIETQLLAAGAGLRSKTPELVRQEWWGLLLAHYAIRALIVDAAQGCPSRPRSAVLHHKPSMSCAARSPTRRRFPPETLQRTHPETITEILERITNGRRKRTYPRVHKRGNRHNFPIKKPEHQGRHHTPIMNLRPPQIA